MTDSSIHNERPHDGSINRTFYVSQVTAANPVSSQTQDVFLTADVMVPLANPEFLSLQKVVAANDTHLYTIRVLVDTALGVTFT